MAGDCSGQKGAAGFSGRRLSANGFPALPEFIDIEFREARNFRGKRLTAKSRRPPLHKGSSAYLGALRSAARSMCGPPLERKSDRSIDTHIARFAQHSQSFGRVCARAPEGAPSQRRWICGSFGGRYQARFQRHRGRIRGLKPRFIDTYSERWRAVRLRRQHLDGFFAAIAPYRNLAANGLQKCLDLWRRSWGSRI